MGSRVDGMQHMLLRQRILQALDKSGWSTVLVLLDVTLSFLSVMLYIVMTYGVLLHVLYDIDFGLAIFFGLNWLFWFWLAEDRLRFVFSFMTLIDLITVGSAFVLYGLEGDIAQNLPGLNFLRILRVLRVLRVFQMKHVMQRHLEGAVIEAAAKLVSTLVSILFIAAGLFYELEKYGPAREEENEVESTLQFHQALYWASVTLTTVGYGDFSPSWWATQIMLIFLLVLTFSLLPYLTGQLMDALASSTQYQRTRFSSFSRRNDIGHVVIMGALDGPTLEGLVSELYHEDKGFNHQQCVLLCPRPPSQDQQHVLATHQAARKLHYLQGSPFRTQDLARAGCAYASAVFIIAPKHAEEPLLADRHNIMMCLSLGQYLQEAHVVLRQELRSLPNRVWHWIRHGHMTPPTVLPTIFIQINLPESRIRLHQVLRSLQDSHRDAKTQAPSAYSAVTAAATAAATAATEHMQQQKQQPSAAVDGNRLLWGFLTAGFNTGKAPTAQNESDRQQQQERQEAAAFEAGAIAGAAAAAKAALKAAAAGIAVTSAECDVPFDQSSGSDDPPTGATFWHHFGRSMRVMCLTDVKHAMMAHTLLGVPGVMTLLSNLSNTTDYGQDNLGQNGSVPQHLKDYMVGASQELYQLVVFPEALHGVSFKTAAHFIYDNCHAVLLAVEETQGAQRHLLTVADLEQVIHASMHGYLIADDIGAVVDVEAVEAEDFQAWQQQQQTLAAAKSQLGPANSHQPAADVYQKPQQVLHHLPSSAGAQQQRCHSAGVSRHMLAWHSQLHLSAAERERTRDSGWSGDDSDGLHSDQRHDNASQQQTPQEPMRKRSSLDEAASIASAAAASAAVAAITSSVAMIGQHHKELSGAFAAVLHLLRSPSHQLQQYGESFMRQHYHLRKGGSVKVSQDMLVSRVPRGMSGHILVLGVPRSQESLLALLAPLRSRRLNCLRPIVIIDSELPGRGGCWNMIAKFQHTYYVQMRAGLNEALLNGNAETASHAVLLSPLSSHEDESDDNKLTSQVLTDAMIIHMYQLLHSLNPNMQLIAELMLPQNMAYLAPTTPLRGVEQKQQVMLSPAYVSGSVFMSRTLDDLLVAGYYNNIGDRIMLQLLHNWHLGGRMAACIGQALDADQPQQQAEDASEATPHHLQQSKQQQHQQKTTNHKQQQQQQSVVADVETGLDALGRISSTGGVQQQWLKKEPVPAAAASSGGDFKVGTPTILMVPVQCSAGTPYRSYFHHLLLHQNLLLLGLYRLVQQGGLQYRVTLTNPHHTTLQSDDLAYVVSTLKFSEQCDSSSAAAAWPPGTVGFNNLAPPPATLVDVLDVVKKKAGGKGTSPVGLPQQQQQQQQQQNAAQVEQVEEAVQGEEGDVPGGVEGSDETFSAATAELEPTDKQGLDAEVSSRIQQQSQQPETAAAELSAVHASTGADFSARGTQTGSPDSTYTGPSGGPPAGAAAAAAAAPSSPRYHDDSHTSYNSTSSFPRCGPAAMRYSSMTDMYTPAGTASSGTAGPGLSSTAAAGDAAGGGPHRSVINVPGLISSMAKRRGQQRSSAAAGGIAGIKESDFTGEQQQPRRGSSMPDLTDAE